LKHIALVAIAACTLTAGCSIRTERTVVEKPVPATVTTERTTTIPSDLVSPATTTTTTYVTPAPR